ncbi:band 4.1-like protein 2 isoform X9 [Lepisosteus oculatus]|uniref:band 4.1-like protein 2 isoform X9 n=1 Tax=Lepisosteus oculatus TaxID=7918 RepID=UPI0035F526B3
MSYRCKSRTSFANQFAEWSRKGRCSQEEFSHLSSVGTEAELKRESEKPDELPVTPEEQTAAPETQPPGEAAEALDPPTPQQENGVGPQEPQVPTEDQDQDQGQTGSGAPEQPASPSPPPDGGAAQTSPAAERKEREQAAGKGLSRFLPAWLRKPKSPSQAEPTESSPAEEDGGEGGEQKQKSPPPSPSAPQPEGKEEQSGEGAGVPPAEDRHEQEELKADEKEEKHSISSAETQPAKEERREDTLDKDTDLKEEVKDVGGDKKPEEHAQKPALNADKPSVKPPKKMKMVTCKVTLLDGTDHPFEIEKRAKGLILFQKVCEHLNLLEKDYFGLAYKDNTDQKCWLDPSKEIKRQIRNSPWQFAFNVKFYPPDPSQLTEDITRYFLCLQLRQDIASGRLPCSFVTHSLLGSYTLQAEQGDYDPEEHHLDYTSDFQFAPSQTKEMEEKVIELYKTHRGLTPAQADAQFLENAKKLSMYGVDLHHAKDSEGVDIMLGVCANGLLIYKDRLRINRFAWPKILKISYKRSNFYIKIRPGETEQFESTIGFKLPNHKAAKKLWKVCVEHHTFFRLVAPEQPPKAKFLTLGSKFRYSGRTQAQTRQASTLIDRPAPYFERTSSKRVSRSLDGAPVVNIADQSLPPDAAGKADGVAGRESGDAGTLPRTALELSQESKVEGEQVDGATAPATEAGAAETKSLRVKGENIYVRHSNLMLEDLDKTQEDVLKHQASISELKRSFMESSPEPRPNQWEKRLTATLPLQTQGRTTEGAIVIAPPESLSLCLATQPAEKTPTRADGSQPGSKDVTESSDDKQKPETCEQAEVEIEETVVIEEIRRTPKVKTGAQAAVSPEIGDSSVKQEKEERRASTSSGSHSESEDEAEYHPEVTGVSPDQVKAGPEEKGSQQESVHAAETPAGEVAVPLSSSDAAVEEDVEEPKDQEHEEEDGRTETEELPEAATVEEPRVNGDMFHGETEHIPQVICCSEPPVVKTEMVTISDAFAAQKMEISTKEVPIVHTETKTITYEASQLDGGGEGEPGILMTAQTITSESLCTTTTTHITKVMVREGQTVKGGLSETRIEKRIVITGDADIDHDEALAQAIKEAKEQHPDMSVTRVVVHKETELTEEEED